MNTPQRGAESQPMGFLVLAAGKGTRMHSTHPKVLQKILGKSLLGYVLNALRGEEVWIVVGFGAEEVEDAFPNLQERCLLQHSQLGTGDAVRIAWPTIEQAGLRYICVLNGDTPHVPLEELFLLQQECMALDAALGFLSILPEDPAGYGRVVRSSQGAVLRIVEDKDARGTSAEHVGEVNAGMYVLDVHQCADFLTYLDDQNAQREFYITQLVDIALTAGKKVVARRFAAPESLLGVNSPWELVDAEERLRCSIVQNWLNAGVLIRQPDQVVLGPDVRLEPGVCLTGPCELYGQSVLSAGTCVDSHCWINNSVLTGCHIRSFSHLEDVHVARDAVVGPFARLRPGTELDESVRVGNFVEVKKSRLRVGAKAGHLSYLGDSDIAENVNIGAGTITCNYDGQKKHRTVVEEGAFIGSNTALVAPVRIGAGALVGAGSVVTKNVPEDTLCVARARQTLLPLSRKKSG